MGRTLKRAQENLTLALAGTVLCVVAVLPLAAVVAEAPGGALGTLGSAAPWLLLFRSSALAAAVTACALAVGVPLGLLLGRGDVPGRRAALLLHAVPTFLPPFIIALGWFYLPHPDALFSIAGAIAVETAAFAPIVTTLVALGVQAIDPSLEEAGRLSAPPWKVALQIVLPAAWPAAALGALLVFALSLSELGVPLFLRIRAYPAAVFARLGAVEYAPGEAAVLALPMLAVSAALLLVERRIGARRSFAVLGLRSEERPLLSLGRYRTEAIIGCWLAAATSVVPLFGLAIRALRGGGFSQIEIGTSTWNSVVPAVLAASVLTTVGLVVGRAVARGRPGSGVLDGISVLAFVTPAAVLGVGIITVWNRPSTAALYRSVVILAVGFAARYAVIPARAIAVAIAQSSPHLEEAAAVHGAGFLRRMGRIVIPLHWRAIAGGWLLAFVFCIRDLETAVLFYPPGSAPLTVRILTMEANGAPAIVAALSLAQCGLVAGSVAAGAWLLSGARR
jgi:iron(III) transport system permease protein